ncbi:2-oxoacid:ferredoxin oxidoreductase subunit beta [Novispirillum sp. DQ9]|uniref:2-oxoacid:ferredoxin oxidoreductase subunit beta n=1 Tax=Novispirillum sp. DQ9 TaxID=3398612 RepID=UPI003C7A5F78
MNAPTRLELTNKDFESGVEVRWCPGCGDYAVLKAVQRLLPMIGLPKERHVFVSGIGCSSRFPYYMATYGFHTIHGRAPAVATGLKLANPDLAVWVITGDGDGLSIGGNHMLHALRRNVDLNVLLFNNAIYGLTKGQASPTSAPGTRTPSTPQGSLDAPVRPAAFALGSGARFVARAVDTQQAQLIDVLHRAHDHKGASFVEIFQNCIVYNDGVYSSFTDKDVAADRQLWLEHGKPMRFGKEQDKGLRLNVRTLSLEVVTLGQDGVSEADLMIHDETNPTLGQMLAGLEGPDMPVPLGVLHCAPAPSYDSVVAAQGQGRQRRRDLNSLLQGGKTWVVR